MNTTRPVVSCIRCASYCRDEVSEAVREAVRLSGGLPAKPYSVLLKANLLSPKEPSRAVTTHPEVLRAIAMILLESGCRDIHIGDNPGYIFRHQEEELFSRTGIAFISTELPVQAGLISKNGFREVSPTGSKSLTTVRVCESALRTPCLINVPKLKTHVETGITGSIKNMFGIADTDTRKKAHGVKGKNFLAEAVIDIFSARIPDLCILDGVDGMEGYGPSHGRSRRVGWIAASDNALALDYVQAVIMGYRDPMSIPLLALAAERFDGPFTRDEIELVGAKWEELPCSGFSRAPSAICMIPSFLRGAAHQLVALKPGLDAGKCTRCGICREVCPVGAIDADENGFPAIDRTRCVHCLCCHELCPTGAMKVKENLASRLLR